MTTKSYQENFDWETVRRVALIAKQAAQTKTPLKEFARQAETLPMTSTVQNAVSNHFIGLAYLAGH